MPLAAPEESASTTTAVDRDATATTAYAAAQHLVEQKRYDEAIVKLDIASGLEPDWAEPVKLRAQVFGELAEKYHPSKQFTAARASELRRLLELEPGVDADRRKNEIAALQQQSKQAAEIEQRRRKLTVPAILVGLASGSLLAGGVMLHSMKPREALLPGTYRQERRDKAGIALMSMGAILLPPAIVLGVLAARQARHDSVARDFNVETDRPRRRANLAVAPTVTRRGGGVGMVLRF